MKLLMIMSVLLATAVFPTAANAGSISDSSLNRLVSISGIAKQVSHFPDLLRIGMDQARQREETINDSPPMSDSEYAELEATMIGAFRPVGILRYVRSSMKSSLSEPDAAKIFSWYDTVLGKRIKLAEAKSPLPDQYGNVHIPAKALLADHIRVQFARKLDDLLHITDIAVQLKTNQTLAMFVAFSSRINPHQPVNTKVLRKALSFRLEKQRARIERMVLLSTLYTYRNIDRQSLEKYLSFLKSPEFMRFNQSLIAGLKEGMNRSMDTMARRVLSLFKKNSLQQI